MKTSIPKRAFQYEKLESSIGYFITDESMDLIAMVPDRLNETLTVEYSEKLSRLFSASPLLYHAVKETLPALSGLQIRYPLEPLKTLYNELTAALGLIDFEPELDPVATATESIAS